MRLLRGRYVGLAYNTIYPLYIDFTNAEIKRGVPVTEQCSRGPRYRAQWLNAGSMHLVPHRRGTDGVNGDLSIYMAF